MHYTSMQFRLITCGMALQTTVYRQNTNIEIMRANGASEEKLCILHFKSAIQISVSAPSGAKISQYLDEIVTF